MEFLTLFVFRGSNIFNTQNRIVTGKAIHQGPAGLVNLCEDALLSAS